MPTLHLANHQLSLQSPVIKWVLLLSLLITVWLIKTSNNWPQVLISIVGMASLLLFGYWLIRKSWVGFTLTATHFQQHYSYGGWVLKWQNIQQIGLCSYHQQGWYQPLPWIGIRLKNYSPFLDSICPRIAREMLYNQRALLYLGMKQHNPELRFEDVVLDFSPYCDEQGKVHTGLIAMLANRMQQQREFYGFDVFIAENDLDRPADEFVGLTRRYLAAAQSHTNDTHTT